MTVSAALENILKSNLVQQTSHSMICNQIEAVSFGWRPEFRSVDIVQRMRHKQFQSRRPKRTLCFCRGNIPGGDVQAGEELCHYLPPFPAKGTGFHRYIYVLFKQDGPINFQGDARPSPWWAGSCVLIRALKLFSIKTHRPTQVERWHIFWA